MRFWTFGTGNISTSSSERHRPKMHTFLLPLSVSRQMLPRRSCPPVAKMECSVSQGRTTEDLHPMDRVIWLPRKTFAEAALINQTTQQKSCLVRNGGRLGTRVHEADAPEVHAAHRPEISYLDGTPVMSYKVGPLPWGTTKASLQKVFNQWQWPARPGQP